MKNAGGSRIASSIDAGNSPVSSIPTKPNQPEALKRKDLVREPFYLPTRKIPTSTSYADNYYRKTGGAPQQFPKPFIPTLQQQHQQHSSSLPTSSSSSSSLPTSSYPKPTVKTPLLMSTAAIKKDNFPSGASSVSLKNNSNNTKADSSPESGDSGSALVLAFILMLVFQLGNRIFGRLQTYPMHNYPIFMNMLQVSIYIPVCFAYILPTIAFTKRISKEQQEIPKYKFAVMGAYDSLAGIMQTFAVNYIANSSTIVLVQQSAIPISMAISKYFLNAQYTYSQYLGAFVVLLGIVVVLIPTLMSSPSGDATAATDNTSNSYGELMWIGVMIVSCIPMCLSSVYKEKALGETEIDVVFLNGWVAVFQFLLSIPLCIPSSLVINMPVSGILPNLYGGLLCWFGIDSINESNLLQTGSTSVDHCSTAPFFVTTYLLFNVVYNILIVVILKHGSANILWMASTVIVPLSNVAFSLDIMPGHQPMRSWDMVGLVVIMIGLVLYRFMPQLVTCIERLTGKAPLEESEEVKRAREAGMKAEGKQTKYVGINQIESLQSLIDTRVWKEQKKALYRSPDQIRGSLLLRLGIPPSPHISLASHVSRGNGNDVEMKSPLVTSGRGLLGGGGDDYGDRERAFSSRQYQGKRYNEV